MFSLKIHPETRRMADFLSAVPKGDVILLETLSAVIDRDITKCRYIFYNAAKIALRESGAVFETKTRVGYRRLHADELAAVGQTARSRGRGIFRRANRAITAGLEGANSMDPKVFRKILAEQSVLGLLEHIARDKSLPNLREQENRPLSIAATAKEFLRSIGSIAA